MAGQRQPLSAGCLLSTEPLKSKGKVNFWCLKENRKACFMLQAVSHLQFSLRCSECRLKTASSRGNTGRQQSVNEFRIFGGTLRNSKLAVPAITCSVLCVQWGVQEEPVRRCAFIPVSSSERRSQEEPAHGAGGSNVCSGIWLQRRLSPAETALSL